MDREVGHKFLVEMEVNRNGQAVRPGEYYEEETKTCVVVSIVHVKSSVLDKPRKYNLYRGQSSPGEDEQSATDLQDNFRAIIKETYRGCHKNVKNLIGPITNADVQRSLVKFLVVMARLQSRISCALCRAIVKSLLQRVER
mmetsp:Transcript_24532/g.64631  ORF Transcript_24532/g.64631 Transcript_24532/m.64631 type:complete len:141 (-) Transcript_24532:72-494(-)